tara:strand:- start:1544 stop:1942 length:399 start_codon:yes stop_codon:yes gene_type:complete
MKFTLKTVVDITETRARRGENPKKVNQQANYNTMFQTLGLRINPEPIELRTEITDVNGMGFGNSIKGKQRVWVFEFINPYAEALNLDMLKDDFDLVPVIKGLDETANINNNIFSTKHENDCNIVFLLELDDK